jgi:modulator of FtsH protease
MQPYDQPTRYYSTAIGVRSGLLAKVAGLLAFAMVFTAGGALVGTAAPGLGLPAMIVALVLSFVLAFVREVPLLNLGVMYLLTTLIGVGLGGIISHYIAAGAGVVVVQAAGTTVLMTIGLSAYALVTRRDFSGLGSWLFFGLLALLAAMIVGIFVGGGLLQFGIGLVGAVLFSLYLIYDVQRARVAADTLPNAIMLAVSIYLDVINLFLMLLRIFGFAGNSRD